MQDRRRDDPRISQLVEDNKELKEQVGALTVQVGELIELLAKIKGGYALGKWLAGIAVAGAGLWAWIVANINIPSIVK